MSDIIGNLRNKITIEESTIIVDEYGQTNRSWSSKTTLWAKKTVSTYNERIKADQLHNEVSYTFLIRYRNDINPNQRIKEDNIYYTIKAVFDESGLKKWLKIIAVNQADETGTI